MGAVIRQNVYHVCLLLYDGSVQITSSFAEESDALKLARECNDDYVVATGVDFNLFRTAAPYRVYRDDQLVDLGEA